MHNRFSDALLREFINNEKSKSNRSKSAWCRSQSMQAANFNKPLLVFSSQHLLLKPNPDDIYTTVRNLDVNC